jgi:molecular chaperone HscA
VRRYVAELFGREPLGDVDPDLVVAYGAAIQADLLARSSDEILLLDVLPLSLGIETMGGGVDKILPRNTTLPAGAKATFTTYADNQTGFDLHVVQGERELAANCRSLARFTLRGIPRLPAGMARLEVEFHVDENGLLHVTARELSTGITQKVEVKPSYGLTDEEVEAMLVDALDHGESDFETRRLLDARVEAERLLLATEKGLASDADLLDAADRARIDGAVASLREAVRDANAAAAIQSRMDELDHATHDWAGRRMNRAVQAAIEGRDVSEIARRVEHAAGVEAHLEAHSRGQG